MKYLLPRLCAIVPSALLLVACADLSGTVPDSQEKAGSSHVTVSLVGPWKKFVEQTQPTFSLSTSDALSQAIPETSDFDQLVLNQLQASLEAGVKVGTPTAPSTAAIAQTIPATNSSLAKPIAQDGFTRFWAANALYEEVQILNKSLKYTPKKAGFHSFIIQTQVSMVPYLRDEPVDAYTSVSFFPKDFNTTNSSEGIQVLPILITDDLETQAETKSREQLMTYALSLAAALHSVNLGASVSDTYENLKTVIGSNYNSAFTVESDSANTIRCRFGAQFQTKSDYALRVQNHKVTMLILVPDGVKDITYMAKTTFKDLNGNEIPSERSYGGVHEGVYGILNQYGLVTKEKLAASDPALAHQVDQQVSNLVEAVETNDAGALTKSVKTLYSYKLWGSRDNPYGTAHPDEQHYLEHIWSDTVDLINTRSQVSTGDFALMDYVTDPLPEYLTKQTAVLVDDGSSITTTVHLANMIGEQGIQAYLTTTATGSTTKVFSSTTKSDDDGNVVLTFPPVVAEAVTPDPSKPELNKPDATSGKLDSKNLVVKVCKGNHTTFASFPALYITKKADVPFKASIHASFIVSQQGNGTVSITIDTSRLPQTDPNEKPAITISADGADIASVVDSPYDTSKGLIITFKAGNWNASGKGTASISLQNLTAAQAVTITAAAPTGTASQSKVLAVTEATKEAKGIVSP